MKIATLQFTPLLGDISASTARADVLLEEEGQRGTLQNLDLLVLPELAFAGYNHPSLAAIIPYLEPTAAGPSTRWAIRTAKKLDCIVAVGYAERSTDSNPVNHGMHSAGDIGQDITAYNSLVFVNSDGNIIAHTRKSFLYYTDETWAHEGSGFYSGALQMGSMNQKLKVVAGICMDINPYKFQSPWTAYEFGNHARESQAELVVLSTAWLTHMSHEELMERPLAPDMNTISYWLDRMKPLLGPQASSSEVIVVFANRTGEEGTAPRIGEVRYAGSSCVMGLKNDGSVRIWDILGKAEEAVLVVDTSAEAQYTAKIPITQFDTDLSDSAEEIEEQ